MRTKHIHLDLDINFEERILSGFCLLSIEKEDDAWRNASEKYARIRIGSASRRAKMTQKNIKQLLNFIFLSAGCSLLRVEGFSCSLEVLYGGLGIS
jgi:hypothetical protein